MPDSLGPWVLASKSVGQQFDMNQRARPGVPRGYVLPEPALFANHKHESSRQSYLKTYLKLRDVLMYSITSLGALASMKSPSDWRSMLALELHGTKEDGKQAQFRRKIRDDLAAVASKIGSSFVCTHFHTLSLH